MEVSGKRHDPDLDECSTNATIYCQPCEEGGKRAVALGLCQTCEEYMCDPCIEAHTRFKVSRKHIMLSVDKMLSFYPSTKQSDIGETEYCKIHPKEMIKFFCPNHGGLGCGVCVVLKHRTCQVDYIDNVAKDFVIGNEFKELEPTIERSEDILSASISNVNELLDEVENQSKYENARLRKFRAKINTYLDRREQELLDNIRKVRIDDENVLNALKSDCESAKLGLEAMRAELSSGDISVNQRYVAARRAEKDIRNILAKNEQMSGLMKATNYRFTKDEDMRRLLESKTGLGTLDVAGEFVPVPDLSTVTWKGTDINVKTTQDQKTCHISGSAVLSSGLLFLADRNNDNVKLLNVPARTVKSRLQLPGMPWDVCALHDDQAAVTLPYNSIIQLMSTKGGQLSVSKEIKVSPDCCGIAPYNNKLYVSNKSNSRIEVMTLDGHIISTFKTDDGRQLFQAPYYLTVSASTPPTLYVSDLLADTVLQMSLDGKVLHEYRDEQLKYPTSLVEVGPGKLLVCGQFSNNVIMLTERDGKMTEILRRKDGLTVPYSVTFCPHSRAIVVGMGNNNSLKVFNTN
ncbi:E3 ubiquitin-protein ligase TRIM71-like [Mya arenaria]|uniref:E3 ubiquitin-protein ligase TRIM71-like n=1 Tax=Mya arenaria TaxID=6604 RepID=UPI0022E906D5|nr:E3 ubiquitin-protein ligase TRIM71-like [Mya arenaria]